jgi:hypothetical protein
MEHSFFEKFTDQQIFSLWNSSQTLVEIAQKLGFTDSNLRRIDNEYIELRKTREVWRKYILGIDREPEKERPSTIAQISRETLIDVMNSDGIQTVSHLALHFLLSSKHGRKQIKQRFQELEIPVKDCLSKGFYGVSTTPIHYPTRFFEDRFGQKPMICPVCNFKALNSRQIELHHLPGVHTGSKSKRNPDYYRTINIEPLCANCHTLRHRTGEHLKKDCGLWRKRRLPSILKFRNPDCMFTNPCFETYRLQKKYYICWVLSSPNDYKCFQCGVSVWGPEQKLLSLELNHKDGNQQNSLISNLELLCPNCHRAHTANL